MDKTREELHVNKTAYSKGDETSRGWACLRSLESWPVWSSGEAGLVTGEEVGCVSIFRIVRAV